MCSPQFLSSHLVRVLQDTEEPDESDYGFTFTTSRDQYWTGPEPDVDGDAEAMLEEAKKQDKPVEKPDTVQIDSNFQMEGAGYEFFVFLLSWPVPSFAVEQPIVPELWPLHCIFRQYLLSLVLSSELFLPIKTSRLVELD